MMELKDIRRSSQRVLARLEPDLNSGCWLWPGSTATGYGTICVWGDEFRLVHRVVYEAHHGPIPSDAVVMHRCDTPLCANPAHLFLGTRAENMQDMVRKGRSGRASVGRGKDVPAEVRATIAARYRRGSSTDGGRALAREFNVDPATVRRIMARAAISVTEPSAEGGVL